MPIYEYKCKSDHHFERIDSFDAPRTTKCPECGKKAERIISLAAFHLKGSGWYSKDTSAKTSSAPEVSKSDGVKKEEKAPSKEKAAEKPAAKKDAGKKE